MKKLYNFTISALIVTLLFWLGYTVVYLFIDGWHIRPISSGEKFLDSVTDFFMNIWILLWFICAFNVVEDHYNPPKKQS